MQGACRPGDHLPRRVVPAIALASSSITFTTAMASEIVARVVAEAEHIAHSAMSARGSG